MDPLCWHAKRRTVAKWQSAKWEWAASYWRTEIWDKTGSAAASKEVSTRFVLVLTIQGFVVCVYVFPCRYIKGYGKKFPCFLGTVPFKIGYGHGGFLTFPYENVTMTCVARDGNIPIVSVHHRGLNVWPGANTGKEATATLQSNQTSTNIRHIPDCLRDSNFSWSLATEYLLYLYHEPV